MNKHLNFIIDGLKRIENGDYTTPISLKGDNELAPIAEHINSIQKQFLVRENQLKLAHEEMQKRLLEKTKDLENFLQELKESESNYGDLVQNVNSIILRMTPKGNVLFFNEFAQKFFGFTEKEILGKNVVGFIVPERDGADKDLRALIEDIGKNPGKYVNNENENILRDGRRKWISWSNKGVLDKEGNTKEILCVGHDITHRKETEEALRMAKEAAEEASRAKSIFLATMSHEIRTPMNGVLGMTELLLETKLSSEQRQKVETIFKSGEALINLINNILDFSKIEAGKLEMEKTDFNLHQVLTDLGSLFKEIFNKKRILFHTSALPGVPVWVRGDGYRLHQILINLLSNAVKFTEKGEVTLTAESKQDYPFQVCFRVKDSGIGIPSHKLDELFQPFTQADSSTTRKFGGTGLGLSIARKLAEIMGGNIRAESVLNQGSIFTLSLPFEKAHEEVVPMDAPEPLTINEVLSKEARILLIEDDPTNQEVIMGMLKHLGMNAELVQNGSEALAKLKQESYSLVFMDCNLPDMDGYSICKAFREWEKTNGSDRRTPIVALTAYAMIGDREKCMAAGMDDYLSKPLRGRELRAALLRWLGEAEKEDILPNQENRVEGSAALREIRIELGEEAIPIMKNFLKDLKIRQASIKNAIEKKQLRQLSREAHTLKGASLSLGFNRLGELAKKFEELGESRQIEGTEELLAYLTIETNHANETLRKELEKT